MHAILKEGRMTSRPLIIHDRGVTKDTIGAKVHEVQILCVVDENELYHSQICFGFLQLPLISFLRRVFYQALRFVIRIGLLASHDFRRARLENHFKRPVGHVFVTPIQALIDQLAVYVPIIHAEQLLTLLHRLESRRTQILRSIEILVVTSITLVDSDLKLLDLRILACALIHMHFPLDHVGVVLDLAG